MAWLYKLVYSPKLYSKLSVSDLWCLDKQGLTICMCMHNTSSTHAQKRKPYKQPPHFDTSDFWISKPIIQWARVDGTIDMLDFPFFI